MRFITLLLVLCCAASFAQVPTRGGALKKREYQTYSSVTLYVGPTGSDSNACTASGTSACLTFGGAMLKLPRNLRHAVTVNVAAGTYTETFRLFGFNIVGANNAAQTAALTVTGVIGNVTPATGTATGTLTSYTGVPTVVGAVKAVAADTGQTWTVNDPALQGAMLQITGGTGSGQYMRIVSNTATTLNLAYNFGTALNATSTYAIVAPTAIFTGAGGTVGGLTGTGALTIAHLRFAPSSGVASALSVSRVQGSVTLTRDDFVGVSGLAVQATTTAALNDLYAEIHTGGGISLGGGNTSPMATSALSGYVHCTTSCSAGMTFSLGSVSNLSGTIDGTYTNAAMVLSGLSGEPTVVRANQVAIDCGGVSGVGVIQTASDAHIPVGINLSVISAFQIASCLTGVKSNIPATFWFDHFVFTACTTGISVVHGARVQLDDHPAEVPFTSVTNELSIEGTSYTYSYLKGLSPSVIASPYGSWIALQ